MQHLRSQQSWSIKKKKSIIKLFMGIIKDLKFPREGSGHSIPCHSMGSTPPWIFGEGTKHEISCE